MKTGIANASWRPEQPRGQSKASNHKAQKLLVANIAPSSKARSP